jgi:CRISP-associated protein Cas1
MQSQSNVATDGIHVAAGYGLKIYVERGHLVVHQGIGRTRNTERFNRARSRLRRLVIIGHTGFVTLEALRWIRDVGAVFVQIDADSTLIATTARERVSTARDLRRAQVLAAETDRGREALAVMLQAKLEAQARLTERLLVYRGSERANQNSDLTVPQAIRAKGAVLHEASSMADLRRVESVAGRYYWQTFAHLPIHFDSVWRRTVPDHWHKAGPRTPRNAEVGHKRPKGAQTPAHAIVNYLYAILETEATIAAYRMGFDPALGLMHSDKRYRPSLASDLMEPTRPAADAIVVGLLEEHALSRGDVYETRRGACRLGPGLARTLAGYAPDLAAAVGPHAERLARTLLRAPAHPTPLTRRRHRASLGTSK